MNIQYSNNSIFIKFDDGDFLIQACSKENAEFILKMYQENDPDFKKNVLTLFDPKLKLLQEEVERIKEKNSKIEEIVTSVLSDKRFFLDENALFRVGIPVPIPYDLALKIQETVKNEDKDELDKLDRFWAWTALIRKTESRESFYRYISDNNLIITKQGFVICFRKANFVGSEENKALQEFVTQNFLRLRKNKKSTNVSVYENAEEEYSLKPGSKDNTNYIGNLKDLYLSFGQLEDCYESYYSGINGKLKFRIGVETRMDETEVDWSTAECSRGIHLHNGKYDDGGYGDTRLAVLLNPMDTVMAPYSDSSKMRVLAITPLAVIGSINDFQLTPEIEDIIDEIYCNHVERLETLLKEGNFATIGERHTLIEEVPEISFDNLFSTIKETMDKSIVKDRLISNV